MTSPLEIFERRLVEYGIEKPYRMNLDHEDVAFVVHSYVETRHLASPKDTRRNVDLAARRTEVLLHAVEEAQTLESVRRAWKERGVPYLFALMTDLDKSIADEVDVP